MPFDSDPDRKFNHEHYSFLPSNHYEVLGVSNSASPEEIKKAYRQKLVEGLHEDKIAGMPEGPEKDSAQRKLEALKEAQRVLENPRLRQIYDTHLEGQAGKQSVSPDIDSPESEAGSVSPEQVKEWFDLAMSRLDLAVDKDAMDAAIADFNANFPGPKPTADSNGRQSIQREKLVSIPEGDFIIYTVVNMGDIASQRLVARELPPFKIGDMLKVKRTSGEVEEGWQVSDFEIKDGAQGPVRIIVLEKDNLIKKVNAKNLREINS